MSTSVEGLADDAGFVARHSNDRTRSAQQDGLDHRHRVGVVDRTMLGVDADVVETTSGHGLGRNRTGDCQPTPKGCFAFPPLIAKWGNRHGDGSISLSVSSYGFAAIPVQYWTGEEC